MPGDVIWGRWCFVPMCKNTDKRTPGKIFVSVPRNPARRKDWWLAAQREFPITKSHIHCCEDHFNLKEDMENYLYYSMMGGPIRLKPGVRPHKFDCQRKVTAPNENRDRLQRKQKILVIISSKENLMEIYQKQRMVSQEFMNILRKQPHQNIPTTSNSATSTGNDRQPLNTQEHEGNLTLKEEKEDYDDTGQPSFEKITGQTDIIIKEEEVDDDNGFEQSLSQTMVGSVSVQECDDTGQPAVKITGPTDVMIKEEEEDVSNAWKQSIKEEEENENNACKQSIKEEEENGSNAWKQSLSQTMVSRVSDTVPSSPHQASKGNEKGITVFAPELPQRLEREERTLHRPSSKRIIKKKIIFDCSDISSSKQKNQRKKTKCKVKKEILCNSGTDKHCMKTSKLLSKICGDEGRVTSRQRDDDLDCKSCKYCGRYVKRDYYMRLHHMKHTGETPYKCSYCTNAYRTRWRLKQHLRTHTNDLPYHCPYCSYRGNRSDYLSSHVKRIHNKELKQSLPQEKKKGVAGSEGRKKKRKGKKFEGNTESFPPQALG